MNSPEYSFYSNEEEVLLSDGIRCKIIDIKKMKEAKVEQNQEEPMELQEPASKDVSIEYGSRLIDSARQKQESPSPMIELTPNVSDDNIFKQNDSTIIESFKSPEARELTII